MTIGIIGAMESEVTLLRDSLKNPSTETLFGLTFYTGTYAGKSVVIACSGIGKVNAARCTQLMIAHYQPSVIVNSGIAGGVDLGLHIADIVIADKLVEHDFDLTPLGRVHGSLGENPERDKPTYFTSDAALIECARKAAATVVSDENVHVGTIVSGDVFIATTKQKDILRSEFQAMAAEMEGAAIGHVAAYCGVAFVIIRTISDLADGKAPASFAEFETMTANRSAHVTQKFIEFLDA